jgi:quinol monooxygenase YgiN
MLRHIAMFKWKPETTQEQKDAARDALAALQGVVPTLRKMTVGHDIRRNTTTNWDMCLVADFDDVEGLEAYFAHPTMNAASDLVASVTQKEITARVQFNL